jgi:hypothetical protein
MAKLRETSYKPKHFATHSIRTGAVTFV